MNLQSTVKFKFGTVLFRSYYINRDVHEVAELPRKMILSNDSYSFGRLGLRLQALRNFCQAIAATSKCKFYVDKQMYEMHLGRIVDIYDVDHPADLKSFNDKEFKFILATNDKLIYPSAAEVGKLLGINPTKVSFAPFRDDSIPLYIEQFDGISAKCRNLTYEDIVVDTNLNQLWPLRTKRPNRPPVEIVNLLKKTTEKIKG